MATPSLTKRLPEHIDLETLAEIAQRYGEVKVEAEVPLRDGTKVPVYSFAFGSTKKEVPTLGIIAGVHGLERIGTRVVTAYLRSVCELLSWDETFKKTLQRCRLIFYPLVNPGGMYLQQRSNPNDVDLMRNAPVESEGLSPWFIMGGQRISPKLPWFRGKADSEMELEAKALCSFVTRELWASKFSVSLDVHSGFGSVDRLWFPYAKTQEPFPHMAEVYGLKKLMDRTYPNHIYCVEPQSKQYLAHGDLWDFLYDQYEAREDKNIFLPLSLELGSWSWVKKNPRQLFSVLGAFNPVLPHRRSRALRRHLLLFDFLLKSVVSNRTWAGLGKEDRQALHDEAFKFWYG